MTSCGDSYVLTIHNCTTNTPLLKLAISVSSSKNNSTVDCKQLSISRVLINVIFFLHISASYIVGLSLRNVSFFFIDLFKKIEADCRRNELVFLEIWMYEDVLDSTIAKYIAIRFELYFEEIGTSDVVIMCIFDVTVNRSNTTWRWRIRQNLSWVAVSSHVKIRCLSRRQ